MICKINKNDILEMVKITVKLINENQETNNINRAKKYLESLGYTSSEQRYNIINAVRNDIPNVRFAKYKYLLGTIRLVLDEHPSGESIQHLNMILKYVTNDTHINEYDSNLNNESLESLYNKFKGFADYDLQQSMEVSNARQLTVNHDYTIVPINNFEESSKYGRYTSWCVTHNENMLKSYTADGSGRFYFCLRNGFQNEPKVKGDSCPLDRYGLSMIAVSVTMDGEVNTITCRWNHDMGGNDSIMTVEELENLLGRNFYQTFKPYSKEELKAKGKYISDVIGSYYNKGGLEGVVAAVDEDENPVLIMSLEQPEKRMTWEEAMKWDKTLRNGWHLPTAEELERVWFVEGNPNVITKKLNNGLKKVGAVQLVSSCYWSSTEFARTYARYVYKSDGGVYGDAKSHGNYVRAFAAVQVSPLAL